MRPAIRLVLCFLFTVIAWQSLSFLGLTCSKIILNNFIADWWEAANSYLSQQLNWSRFFVSIFSLMLFTLLETVFAIRKLLLKTAQSRLT